MLSFKVYYESNKKVEDIFIDSFYDSETKQEIKTGVPVTFYYVHNPVKSGYYGKQYAQDIEPAGKYINAISSKSKPSEHLEHGLITFNSPLVIDWGGYDEKGWKSRLSKAYGNKKKLRLSKAILASGYDGIITVSRQKNGDLYCSEIVDLRVIKDY